MPADKTGNSIQNILSLTCFMVDVLFYFNKFIHIIKNQGWFFHFYQIRSRNYDWGILLNITEETIQGVFKNIIQCGLFQFFSMLTEE